MNKPISPTIKVKIRYFKTANANGTVTVTDCLSIGDSILSLTDFTDMATTFARFVITRAKYVVMPA